MSVLRFLVLRVDGVKEDNADLNSDLAVTMVVTVEVDRRALTGLAAFGVGGSPDTTHDTTVPRHMPIGNEWTPLGLRSTALPSRNEARFAVRAGGGLKYRSRRAAGPPRY